LHRKLGDQVTAGEPLCTIHHNSETRAAQATKLFLDNYTIADTPPAFKNPLVHRIIRSAGKN
jgi:thymidine phosphorylase